MPYFTKDLKKARKPINARSESIAKSGMFRDAFARWRCLVPAPVYYEWRDDPDGKTPFAVARADGEPVAFGGVWETWKSPDGELLQIFATITTDANRQLAGIQDRMPVIIERQGAMAAELSRAMARQPTATEFNVSPDQRNLSADQPCNDAPPSAHRDDRW